ncbi:myeloid-derived growth factor-like [Anneissia japonica]|uniref:myeloid-derived growth factor-like n=1 Tax=Anneissia japonica TaxID=1529436 RepID=UPI00142570E4|nr:myeloid-derived growth factor-like [Anneissia japonica]
MWSQFRYLCMLLSTLYFPVSLGVREMVEDEFFVKPGGEVHVTEKKLGTFGCIFTYAAQGGTHENWLFQISKEENGYICSVERPDGRSYLFFQQFKLAVVGASIAEAEVTGDAGTELRSEEYIIDETKNQVYHAEGKFRSQLTRITILAHNPHVEL